MILDMLNSTFPGRAETTALHFTKVLMPAQAIYVPPGTTHFAYCFSMVAANKSASQRTIVRSAAEVTPL
jgi:hypothetical protein